MIHSLKWMFLMTAAFHWCFRVTWYIDDLTAGVNRRCSAGPTHRNTVHLSSVSYIFSFSEYSFQSLLVCTYKYYFSFYISLIAVSSFFSRFVSIDGNRCNWADWYLYNIEKRGGGGIMAAMRSPSSRTSHVILYFFSFLFHLDLFLFPFRFSLSCRDSPSFVLFFVFAAISYRSTCHFFLFLFFPWPLLIIFSLIIYTYACSSI